ncbi:hypothetical protein OZX61_07365 [Acinetobacter sp. ESL0695]|uniref:hypothetical protein n=1 Tax=Acinetobacter sp. ESL0695 TaxID=2983215 RepID=UPI0023F0AFF4|nr:hypothetical protein [Acinetobacter sp. ESL0695]WEV48108.1 hypothetical protein OZX61_07365 [Acinetobacter sp. ESL0695]
MAEKIRPQNQDDWKRTQIRIPQNQYQEVLKYAEGEELSLNSALIDLIEKGLTIKNSSVSAEEIDIKFIKLPNGKKRLVFGKLLGAFSGIDFTQDFSELKDDIERSLEFLEQTKLKYKLAFLTKKIFVYQGNNHLDIVDDGVGSLNWLIVEDHLTEEYMQKLHNRKNNF